jgi:hypothetical protein
VGKLANSGVRLEYLVQIGLEDMVYSDAQESERNGFSRIDESIAASRSQENN